MNDFLKGQRTMIEEIKLEELVDSRFYKNLYEETKDKIRRERAIHEDKTQKMKKALIRSISLNIFLAAALFCVVYLFLI